MLLFSSREVTTLPADVQRIHRPARARLMKAVLGRHHQREMNRSSQVKSIRKRTNGWHHPRHQAACPGRLGWQVACGPRSSRHPATGFTASISPAHASTPAPPARQVRNPAANTAAPSAIVAHHASRQAAQFVDARPHQPLVVNKSLKAHTREGELLARLRAGVGISGNASMRAQCRQESRPYEGGRTRWQRYFGYC
jgi:hypothetical protein